jgi:phosphoglycolate phosphatase
MPPAPIGFDLDLTLIDSRATILESFALVGAETGSPIDLDLVQGRLGIKLEDELAHWFDGGQLEAAAAIYRRHYVELARRSTPVMPGARAALEAVRAAGAEAVIVTAKHPVSVGPCLEASGIVADQLFADVHGPEKAAVLRRIGAAAYVGDTPPDMAAAVQAAALGIGVTTGSFGEADLLAAGAGAILDTLEQFPGWYAAERRARSASGQGGRW